MPVGRGVRFSPSSNLEGEDLIERSWAALRGARRVHKTLASYEDVLTRTVLHGGADLELYVSVGTGDFVAPWLQRLYHDADSSRGHYPHLRRVILKRLSEELVDSLSAIPALAPDFKERLSSNLHALQQDPLLSARRVEVEVRRWNRIPSFHGFLVADRMLVAPWGVDSSGFLHAHTPLVEFRGSHFADRLRAVRESFERA